MLMMTGWELTPAALVPVALGLTFGSIVMFVGLFHFQSHQLLLQTERLSISCCKHIDTRVSCIEVNRSAALLMVIAHGVMRKIS